MPLLISTACLPVSARAAADFSKRISEMGLDYKDAAAYELQTDRHWGQWPQASAQWTVTTSTVIPRFRVKAYSEVSPSEADAKEKLQLQRIFTIYTGDTAYPGMTSHPTSATAPSILPVFPPLDAAGHQAVFLSATAGLTYGSLLEKNIVYRGVLSFLHCPSTRRFFQIEIFYPHAEFKAETALAEVGRFSCAP